MNTDFIKKELSFDISAKNSLLNGVEQLAAAVGITMGPGGQNVVIEVPESVPILTKDGVTVAGAVNLVEPFENLGVQLVKEAAQSTAETAGDGTTTATVLAHSFFRDGLKAISAGHNAVDIRNGMKKAANDISEVINNWSKPVKDFDEIAQVGTISANGEEEIGQYLTMAMKEVGQDGVITVENAKGFDTTMEKVDGTRLDRGFLSPYFINDDARNCCHLSKPYVLLTNKKISNIHELLPILEKVHQKQGSILIVADDIEGEALNALVLNTSKGVMKICCIKAPEFGQARIGAMADLALLLNTKIINAGDDSGLGKLEITDLGRCVKSTTFRNETIMVCDNVDKQSLEERCEEIREQLSRPGISLNEKIILQRRLSRLAGGVAILRVGGSTEAELRERKDRVEDALHATRAAVRGGILPGGGTALLRAARQVKPGAGSSDFLVGYNIVKRCCEEPIRKITSNAGQVPDIVIEKVLAKKSVSFGYDARASKFQDLMKAGVIDPTLVVSSALKHAISAADNLLSIGCAMITHQE
jgi:chaperonin GroEL